MVDLFVLFVDLRLLVVECLLLFCNALPPRIQLLAFRRKRSFEVADAACEVRPVYRLVVPDEFLKKSRAKNDIQPE